MTYKERQRAPRLQFPCLACNYGCDNVPQILNHYLKRHNFDMTNFVTHEASPEDLGPQFGCPFCVYWCVGNPGMLTDHYEEEHELFLIIDGDEIKQDPEADEKRQQIQKKSKTQEKTTIKQDSDKEETQKETAASTDAKEEEGSQEAFKKKSGEESKESTPAAEEQKHSPIMQKLMELMDLVKKHEH
jgi:hypothetical protein